MAILYHGEPNGPSLSVLAALYESGLDIETRPIDLLAGERHALPGVSDSVALDYAVEGEGPVLVANGEAMCEAVFLAQYFDEAADGCGLQPSDPYARWQMLMWCRQATERLSPAVAYLGNLAWSQKRLAAMPTDEFERVLDTIASDDQRARWQNLRDDSVDAAKVEELQDENRAVRCTGGNAACRRKGVADGAILDRGPRNVRLAALDAGARDRRIRRAGPLPRLDGPGRSATERAEGARPGHDRSAGTCLRAWPGNQSLGLRGPSWEGL